MHWQMHCPIIDRNRTQMLKMGVLVIIFSVCEFPLSRRPHTTANCYEEYMFYPQLQNRHNAFGWVYCFTACFTAQGRMSDAASSNSRYFSVIVVSNVTYIVDYAWVVYKLYSYMDMANAPASCSLPGYGNNKLSQLLAIVYFIPTHRRS